MRFVLAVALLSACSPDDAAPIGLTSADVTKSWHGDFEGNGCVDGAVDLQVAEVEDGWFEGTYDYVSTGAGWEGWHATYAVHGDVEDGTLVLDQADLVEADAPETLSWCFGEMQLDLDDGGMVGDWVANDCACDGGVFLQTGV